MKTGRQLMGQKGQGWTALSHYRSFTLVHRVSWQLKTLKLLLHYEPISEASRACIVSTSVLRIWAKGKLDPGGMVGRWVDIRKISTMV